MSTDRVVYAVPKNHLVRDVVAEYRALAQAALDAWKAYTEEQGATSFSHTRGYGQILGIHFTREQRKEIDNFWSLWVQDRKSGAFRPNSKTNKAMYKQFKSLAKGPGWDFVMNKLNVGLSLSSGMSMVLPTVEEYGDKMFLLLAPDHKAPKGVRQIKHSTYWKHKEATAA